MLVQTSPLLFHQFQDSVSKTFTYLLACPETREAALIDTVYEEAEYYLKCLDENELTLKFCLETHVHADHKTGAFLLEKITGCQLVYGIKAPLKKEVLRLAHGDFIGVGKVNVICLETPGHTDHDVSFLCMDRVFTGDCLLIQECGRTDFQSGSSAAMWDSVTSLLFDLPSDTLVYPGHDYKNHRVSSIEQEKSLNQRFTGQTLNSFSEIMANLNLSPPKKIDIALPYNTLGQP